MDKNQLSMTIINQWKQDYQALFEVLTSEQSALEKRDFEALTNCTREKDTCVAIINSHEIPTQIFGPETHRLTLGDFSHYCMQSDSLKSHWKNLMELVAKCSFQNEVNGRLVQLLNDSSKRTFNLLRGFDPDNNIYDATGSRSMVSRSKASVSA